MVVNPAPIFFDKQINQRLIYPESHSQEADGSPPMHGGQMTTIRASLAGAGNLPQGFDYGPAFLTKADDTAHCNLGARERRYFVDR
jgi:hypothetical protein